MHPANKIMPQAVIVPSQRQRRRARILLAEDDGDLRDLIATVLSSDGYEIVQVRDGAELVEYLDAGRSSPGFELPDVILSDVCMPGRTGFDVLEELRSAGITTPVVLMTAFAEHFTESRARELGALTMLEKPFEIDDLRMVVLNVAPARAARRPN
jgi:DNA-binding response OmpR family regulator